MFLTDCLACGLRELRGARSIELLANTEHGPELVYRCSRCDTLGLVHVGASETTRRTAPAPVAA